MWRPSVEAPDTGASIQLVPAPPSTAALANGRRRTSDVGSAAWRQECVFILPGVAQSEKYAERLLALGSPPLG